MTPEERSRAAHPSANAALVAHVDQLSAMVRDLADSFDVDLSDPQVRRALYAMGLTLTQPGAEASFGVLALLDAWNAAIK